LLAYFIWPVFIAVDSAVVTEFALNTVDPEFQTWVYVHGVCDDSLFNYRWC